MNPSQRPPAHQCECHVLRDAGRWLLAVVLAGTTVSAAPAAGWRALVQLKADEALRQFAAEPVRARDAEFGRAVALLARQPVSPGQVAVARTTFAHLADSGTDEVAQGSRYFLGRIAQHHLEQADPAEAERQYRRLLTEHPDSLWAQTALTRLALLELYPADPAIGPAKAVAAGEQLLAAARLPVARSELHLVLADAIFYYRLPVAAALPHLLAAEQLGRLDRPTRADTLVQIAEVSMLTGDRAQARRFYETFLAEYPLDQRRFMVKRKLAEFQGA